MKVEILSDKTNRIEIKRLQRTVHITPINLEEMAEKYAMCEWDSESKIPMRILLSSGLDKYGVVWFKSPSCFQITLYSHNEKVMEMIMENVMRMINKTVKPSAWDRLIMRIKKEWELWEKTLGTYDDGT